MSLGFSQYSSTGSEIFSVDKKLISFKYSLGLRYLNEAETKAVIRDGGTMPQTSFSYPNETVQYRTLRHVAFKNNGVAMPFKSAYGVSNALYPRLADIPWFCMPSEILLTNSASQAPYIRGTAPLTTDNAKVVVTSAETTTLDTSKKYFEVYDENGESLYNLSNYSRHSNLQYMFHIPANTCTTSNLTTFPANSGNGMTIRYIKSVQVTSKDGYPLFVPGITYSPGTDTTGSTNITGTNNGVVFKWDSTGTVLNITYYNKYPSSLAAAQHYYFANKMNEVDINIPIMSFPTVDKDYYNIE